VKIAPDVKLVVLIAWATYIDTLDERDKRIAMTLTQCAAEGHLLSEEEERDFSTVSSDLFSCLSLPQKRKKSRAAKKRKAFKHCVRIDAGAPILAQARNLAR
jgi:hypothetical protein